MIEYGLCNPIVDKTLEDEIRRDNPNWSDKKVLTEQNRIKKKETLFSSKNTKENSTKRIKKVKVK